jgi:hypothetical protein
MSCSKNDVGVSFAALEEQSIVVRGDENVPVPHAARLAIDDV